MGNWLEVKRAGSLSAIVSGKQGCGLQIQWSSEGAEPVLSEPSLWGSSSHFPFPKWVGSFCLHSSKD